MSLEKTSAHNEVAVRSGTIDDAIQLAADVANERYSKWTPSMFRLHGCLAVAYLCGCLNGVSETFNHWALLFLRHLKRFKRNVIVSRLFQHASALNKIRLSHIACRC